MQPGAYMDVAQVTLYVFWIFFAALIFYLRREDKREGYPLVSDAGGRRPVYGIPVAAGSQDLPAARRQDRVAAGLATTTVATSRWRRSRRGRARPTCRPAIRILDGVGPGSYADREDVPELTLDDHADHRAAARRQGHHPRSARSRSARHEGVGCDGQVGGTVVDVWVDRAEALIRYLEVEVKGGRGTKRVLLPLPFALVDRPQGLRLGRRHPRCASSPTRRRWPSPTRSPSVRKTASSATTAPARCTPPRGDRSRLYERRP